MRSWFLLCAFLLITACSESVPKPANLIEEEKMSQIIADFAIADQINNVRPKANLDAESLLILKKYGIKGDDFVNSYQYYISKPAKLEAILDEAQQLVVEKKPEGKKYIEQKLKKQKIAPANDR